MSLIKWYMDKRREERFFERLEQANARLSQSKNPHRPIHEIRCDNVVGQVFAEWHNGGTKVWFSLSPRGSKTGFTHVDITAIEEATLRCVYFILRMPD